jgi:hypothetical protein
MPSSVLAVVTTAHSALLGLRKRRSARSVTTYLLLAAPAGLDVRALDLPVAGRHRRRWTGARALVRRRRADQPHGTASDRSVVREAVAVAVERVVLLRRLAQLERTKRWFAMWHVFHQPLVYLMFGIAALRSAVVVYLGCGFN